MNYAEMTISELEAAIGIEYTPGADGVWFAEPTPEQLAVFFEWLNFHPEAIAGTTCGSCGSSTSDADSAEPVGDR